jgi:hypothetical protein
MTEGGDETERGGAFVLLREEREDDEMEEDDEPLVDLWTVERLNDWE